LRPGLVERDPRALDPLAVRLRRERALQFGVVDDAPLLGVDEQHLAAAAPFRDDLALGNVEHADPEAITM
jgi:hypothetical protein